MSVNWDREPARLSVKPSSPYFTAPPSNTARRSWIVGGSNSTRPNMERNYCEH